ncbi:hypothetical protein Tco_0623357 [Tanacetum coccineum]
MASTHGKISRIREQALLRTRNDPGQRSGKEPMLLEKREEEESMIGKIAIGSMLSVNYKQQLIDGLRINEDKTSIEGESVMLAEGRDNQKGPVPLMVKEEESALLMGYRYRCFLQLPKDNSEIRMTKDDEEKTGFYIEEGVYCFTHMPKILQRMMEKVLANQKGRNVEVYLEEIS